MGNSNCDCLRISRAACGSPFANIHCINCNDITNSISNVVRQGSPVNLNIVTCRVET